MSAYEQSAPCAAAASPASSPPLKRYLIGRYHEIVLKGGNRWRFVDQLKRNVRALFADCRIGRVRGEGPRLIIEIPAAIADDVVHERAALLFGFQNFTVSRPVPLDIEELKREAVAAARGQRAKTFRIATRRADKRFALNSMEIDRIVGAEVAAALGLKVDLSDPELTITIEILPDSAFIAVGKYPGAGGLPVGISGRATVLLSGGIDSPVAAYRMMRRGRATRRAPRLRWCRLPRSSAKSSRARCARCAWSSTAASCCASRARSRSKVAPQRWLPVKA
jgi:thiamine biosynthesis protein ThiI